MIGATPVFSASGSYFSALSAGTRLATCRGMLSMIAAPALTLVLLGVVVGLGAAFVWALWEFEPQIAKLQRALDHALRDRFG
jgi:hypothetical protein